MPSPRLVRPCRSPGRTFEVSRGVTVPCSLPRGCLQGLGPHGLRSSLERDDIAGIPSHRPRSVHFPIASLEIRQGCCSPDSLSSTSSPASAFPQCFHRFGHEQQARVAFRPCRFTRLRRFSPPIARVHTELLVTFHGDEGLADLLRSAANRRVRCVSFTHPVEPAPRAVSLLTPFLAGHSDLCFPASKFVPPGGFPPPAARCVATSLDSRHRVPCLLGLSILFNPRPSR